MFNLLKKNKTPLLQWAIPNEHWEMVLDFDNGERRFYSSKAEFKNEFPSYLAFSYQFREYVFSPKRLVWRNGQKLDHVFLYENASPVTEKQLQEHSLWLGVRNGSLEDDRCFNVGFFPFRDEKLFKLCEYSANPHEGGGCADFSLKELMAYEVWEKHFENSGCAWAAEIIKAKKDQNDWKYLLVEAARQHTPFS